MNELNSSGASNALITAVKIRILRIWLVVGRRGNYYGQGIIIYGESCLTREKFFREPGDSKNTTILENFHPLCADNGCRLAGPLDFEKRTADYGFGLFVADSRPFKSESNYYYLTVLLCPAQKQRLILFFFPLVIKEN